jgi:polynucleotide 5'-kinase involved in rRNA processing
MEERQTYRTTKFRDYFKHSLVQELALEAVQIEGEVLDPNGESIPLDWALRINGLLIGLKDSGDETLALGVIRNYLPEKKVVRVLTPVIDIQRVKTIQLSSLKIIPL